MRLTLRTLLAYLDDVLEAEQAKELGEKIQQTPLAQNLINRIRDVLRRRRLMAPDVSGPSSGLDPNAIAEYLDNTLSPDEVADVEKVCLESDVHLAEVAACHQILAAVLGEPVDVPRTTRERMYALAPRPADEGAAPAPGTETHSEDAGKSKDAPPASPEVAASQNRPADAPPTHRSSIHDRLPEFLARPSLARRLLPYAVITLIAAFWFGLFLVDPTFLGRRDASVTTPQPPATIVPMTDETGADRSAGEADVATDSATDVNSSAPEGSEITAQNPAPGGETPSEASQTDVAAGTPSSPVERPAVAGEPSSGSASSGETELPGIPVASAETPVVASAETPPVAGGNAKATQAGTNPPRRLFPPDGAATATPAGAGSGAVPRAGTPETAPERPAPDGRAAASSPPPASTSAPASGGKPDRTLARVDTPPAPAPAPVAPEAVLPVEYSSTQGILLRYDPDRRGWFVLPRRALIRAGDEIACPAPFEAELVVGRRQLIVRLDGGTRLQLVRSSPQAGIELNVVRGRLAISGGTDAVPQPAVSGALPPIGVPEAPAPTTGAIPGTVRIGQSVFRVVLETADAICGLEVQPPQPRGFEDRSAAGRFGGGIFVVRGRVTISTGERKADLGAQTWVPLSPELVQGDGPLPTSQLLSVPEWLATDDLRNTAIRRRYATLFEKEFDPALPVESVLPTVVLNPPPGISQLAAECLGLIEHVPGLVKALALSEYEEAREVAVRELRIWLLRDEKAAKTLRAALAAHFSADDVETVYELLWGYPPAAAADPKTSARLVDLLEHDQLPVRYLAFYNIYLLTGRKNDYRPDAPLAQRLAGVKRWRLHLERMGALVKPE